MINTARNRFTTFRRLTPKTFASARSARLESTDAAHRAPINPMNPMSARDGAAVGGIPSPSRKPRDAGDQILEPGRRADALDQGSGEREPDQEQGEQGQERGVGERGSLRAHVVEQALDVHLDRHLHRPDDAGLHPRGEAAELDGDPSGSAARSQVSPKSRSQRVARCISVPI